MFSLGTVRQNIIFGHKYDKIRYKEVIRVCSLKRDFLLLPYGDYTVVGERGISLSGGQRARINLARTVYKNSDVYLLDDPLSAVDTHVGRALFDECIKGFLSNKVVVLATHQLQYLQTADQIVILKDGNIQAKGSYKSLQESGIDFAKLLKSDQTTINEEEEEYFHQLEVSRKAMISTTSTALSVREESLDIVKNVEMRSEGSVSCTVYKGYLFAGGNIFLVICVFIMFILAQGVASAADYFASEWWVKEKVLKPDI